MADNEELNEDLVCICTQPIKQGFRNEGASGYEDRWWVHVICGKPTPAWLKSIGDDMLNFFRGGSLDGLAYETSTLLDMTKGHVPITEYKWTPETIRSEKTGRIARVWVHKESLAAGTVAAAPPVEQPMPGPAQTEDGIDVTMVANNFEGPADLRKRLKLSRKQVAQMTGLSEAKIARIESGSARTTEDEMGQVMEALEAHEASVS